MHSRHHPVHIAASIKQLNQNCFLAPKDLFFFNDNMLPCEGVEKWPCQPRHEGFKKKETAGNRKQKLPPHLPHHFIAFTSVIVIHPHHSQQRSKSLCGFPFLWPILPLWLHLWITPCSSLLPAFSRGHRHCAGLRRQPAPQGGNIAGLKQAQRRISIQLSSKTCMQLVGRG